MTGREVRQEEEVVGVEGYGGRLVVGNWELEEVCRRLGFSARKSDGLTW